jgi:hypothetical protein
VHLKFRFIPLLLLLVAILSCEENDIAGPQPVYGNYIIERVTVSPTDINFVPSDGAKDSTVTINVSATIGLRNGATLEGFSQTLPTSGNVFVYNLRIKGSDAVISSSAFTIDIQNRTISADIPLETSTFDFNDYLISIYARDSEQIISNDVQATIKVRGFSLGAPILLFAENPDTVRIPSSGTQPFLLTAKVSHDLNMNLVHRVLVIISDQNNTVLNGSPFRLYDDGSSVNVGTGPSGDLVAGDSLYSRRFEIGPNNNPDIYTLRYFAIDNFGNSSDTVQTQMIISN